MINKVDFRILFSVYKYKLITMNTNEVDLFLKSKNELVRISPFMKNHFSFQPPSQIAQSQCAIYNQKKRYNSRSKLKKIAILPQYNSRKTINEIDYPIKPKRIIVQYKYQKQKQQLNQFLKSEVTEAQGEQQVEEVTQYQRGGARSQMCSYSNKNIQLMQKMQTVKAQAAKLRAYNLPGFTNDINSKKTMQIQRSLTLLSQRKYQKRNLISLNKNQSKASLVVKNLLKGYIAYDSQAKRFLQQHKTNLHKIPKFTNNFYGISAKYFFVLNAEDLTVVAKKKSAQSIEIASLTKIMTAYLCILVCKKYQIDIDSFTLRVSEKASQMPGTSAQLQTGDILSIKQLLYALMLPSGNDASVALAQGVGKIIQKYKKKPSTKNPYQIFISHMNILSKQLQLSSTFQNSSGLSGNPNFSTAEQISLLSAICIRNGIFKQIINTKQYQLEIKNQRFGLKRKQIWKNTNKLLWKNWKGVKTGTTDTAGHCLIGWKDSLIYCVCDCESLSKRFTDCIKLEGEITKKQQNEQQLVKSKQSQFLPMIDININI